MNEGHIAVSMPSDSIIINRHHVITL